MAMLIDPGGHVGGLLNGSTCAQFLEMLVVSSIGHMLNEFLDSAAEVDAQPVKDVRASAVALVIEDLRQRHAVHAGSLGHLLHGDAARFLELLLLDLLSELESNHKMP